jgi:hypothetical protein
VTFKDLQRLVESEASNSDGSPQMQKLVTRLRDKPFWINSEKEHKKEIGPVKEIVASIT